MAERRFGMTGEDWRAARRKLEELLVDAARAGRTVTYGEAARRAFGDRFSARSTALMALLSEVDSEMLERDGVMIATLVVRADTGRPGDGYFSFAERNEGGAVTNRESYWTAQSERVWAHFGATGQR